MVSSNVTQILDVIGAISISKITLLIALVPAHRCGSVHLVGVCAVSLPKSKHKAGLQDSVYLSVMFYVGVFALSVYLSVMFCVGVFALSVYLYRLLDGLHCVTIYGQVVTLLCKGGSSGMLWRGQMMFGEEPNCPVKSILSLHCYRHNVKALHRLGGSNNGFRAFRRGHGPVAPPPPPPRSAYAAVVIWEGSRHLLTAW